MSAKMMPRRKPRFSEAIKTKDYQSLIYNTLGDPNRSRRFIASITSAVAVNAQLQECDAGSILAGSLLGESLGLQPSPQLGQYYLVPFDCRSRGRTAKLSTRRTTRETRSRIPEAGGCPLPRRKPSSCWDTEDISSLLFVLECTKASTS